MGPASQALSSDPAAAEKAELPAESERNRLASERRIPTARETLATLPEHEGDVIDFEAHDTIPAPPWLEDELGTPNKTP